MHAVMGGAQPPLSAGPLAARAAPVQALALVYSALGGNFAGGCQGGAPVNSTQAGAPTTLN